MANTLLDKVRDEKILHVAWGKINAGKNEDVRAKSRGIDDESLFEFGKNLAENIRKLSQELSRGNYASRKLYGFTEPKKSGKVRLIAAPTVRDRVVQTSILFAIQKYYPGIRNLASFCLPRSKKKSQRVSFIHAFQRLVKQVIGGNVFVFESDIESFFDKVKKEKLFDKIKKNLPDRSIDHLIGQVIYYEIGNIKNFKKLIEDNLLTEPKDNIGMCQGSPLSPLFANIYLQSFDESMISIFKKNYIRYVDDFIVLCRSKNETIKALPKTTKLLSREGLTLPPAGVKNRSKTRTNIDLKNGDTFDFLGITVSKNSIEPTPTIKNLRKVLDSELYKVKDARRTLKRKGKRGTPQEIQAIINQKIQGYFGSYGFFHTEEKISEINKHINVKNKQSKQNVKKVTFHKRVKKIISKQGWQALFNN